MSAPGLGNIPWVSLFGRECDNLSPEVKNNTCACGGDVTAADVVGTLNVAGPQFKQVSSDAYGQFFCRTCTGLK